MSRCIWTLILILQSEMKKIWEAVFLPAPTPSSEFNKICDIITKGIKERRQPENLKNEKVDTAKNMKRKQLLSTHKKRIRKRIPMLITYSRYLSNRLNIIKKIEIFTNITNSSKIISKETNENIQKKQKSFGAYRRWHSAT